LLLHFEATIAMIPAISHAKLHHAKLHKERI
jgi:hypothetical protein